MNEIQLDPTGYLRKSNPELNLRELYQHIKKRTDLFKANELLSALLPIYSPNRQTTGTVTQTGVLVPADNSSNIVPLAKITGKYDVVYLYPHDTYAAVTLLATYVWVGKLT